MAKQTIYPAASLAQDFEHVYTGSVMNPNVVVLHSTEGTGWPGYSGGAVAPNFTIMPDFATKTVKVRQHYPANRSSRALENHAGGVETNTLNAVQIEMVGTCDPTTHKAWGSTPHIYMPDAPDWFLQGVADLLRWLSEEWTAFPLVDGAPRGWGAYPGSYGAAKTRMTYAEWNASRGVVGHEHVPENVHGDPGAFPIARTLAFAKGDATLPTTPVEPTEPAEPTSVVAVWDKPETWAIGSTGDDVTRLGERIVVWSKALGLPSPYKVGPGSPLGAADVAGLSALQVAWGFGSSKADLAKGGNSDGYPGPSSFEKLASDPAPVSTPKTVSVTSEFLNWAGYNGITAPGVLKWKRNVDGIVPLVLDRHPDIFNVAEVSDKALNRMRPRIDATLKGYDRGPGGSDGRYNYRRTATTDRLAAGTFTTPNTAKYRLKGDDKQAAWVVYRKDGALAMDVSCHTENEASADTIRVNQALYFLDKALAVAKEYGVPEENVALFGDFNSESYVANAFDEHGWKVAASGNFVGWTRTSKKRFDLAVVKKGVKASGSEVSSHGFSDHNGVTLTRELIIP